MVDAAHIGQALVPVELIPIRALAPLASGYFMPPDLVRSEGRVIATKTSAWLGLVSAQGSRGGVAITMARLLPAAVQLTPVGGT